MASTDISLFAYEVAELKKEKSPTALRTISEAAEILDVPQHVLRFWETKFPQIKPLKRNGGRRFYRPQDLDVLQQIKHLLYNQGYTIKGAKKAVDEFLHANSEREVSSEEWIASIPPASVNDNFATPAAPVLVEMLEATTPFETQTQDISLDAIEETFDVPSTGLTPQLRQNLEMLRNELIDLRATLAAYLPAASPVYQ